MRHLGPCLFVALACACSVPNRTFGVLATSNGEGDTDSEAASAGATPTDDATQGPLTTSSVGDTTATTPTSVDPTTTTGTTAPVDPTTGNAAADPTTEPSVTSETADDGTTGEYVCDPTIHPTATSVARLVSNQESWTTCKKPIQTMMGQGAMINDALLFYEGECVDGAPQYTYELGAAYPALKDRKFCGKITIAWDPTFNGCKIAAMSVEQFVENSSIGYIYGRYHAPSMPFEGLPLLPEVVDPGSCGCPEPNDTECCDLQPGQHAIKIGQQLVEPGMTRAITNTKVTFTNWNASIDPSCLGGDALVQRVDWFFEVDQ